VTGAALRLTGIAKRFGATQALDGASLEVAPGEVHALFGENGAGKSTLLGILAGLESMDEGRMELLGRPHAPRSPREARGSGIALIHQELSLFPHLSVAENILIGREPRRFGLLDLRQGRRLAAAVLEEFGHGEISPDTLVKHLPLPARQVVEICRAAASGAAVLLMDEPTSSLQQPDVLRLFALIRRLAASGAAIVYISHFLEEARAVASRYTVLRDGRTVDSGVLGEATNEDLIRAMVGRTVSELYPSRQGPSRGAPALEVRGLALRGVREASFDVRPGEILGIFGLMGSGRTEALRGVFGLEGAEGGTVSLEGHEESLRTGSPAKRLAQGFGYLSEDRKGEGLAVALSVADNVTLPALSRCSRHGLVDRAAQRSQAERCAGSLGVRMASVLQKVKALSGGNQQKVALARLVHQEARVLLLDEPTRGIDIGSKAQIYEAIAALASEGKAVVFVSSYLPELLGLCDRIAVMSRGRLSPARPAREWTPESAMEAAVSA
jgi:ribose transport system ATP-binding protein